MNESWGGNKKFYSSGVAVAFGEITEKLRS
jgi:hypothetical protein